MILVLLGPPGSGKGTQATRLSSQRSWPHLSTGDMLRTAISRGTKLGLEAKSLMDQGLLVSDSVVVGLITERSLGEDCKQGFILDGFPRTIEQAQALDTVLAKNGKAVDLGVLFDMPEADLIKRLSGRRTCLKCGSMYHVDGPRPEVDGVCDRCGAEVVQRDDDRIEVVQKRLEVYHQKTEPLIQFYRNQKKLTVLNAACSPVEVESALAKIVERGC